MHPDRGSVTPTRVLDRRVLISKWVNEKVPAWDQILTAHDVARLIRRQRWTLSTLAILGKVPQKQRFRGRGIGWLRDDVLVWMARSQAGRAPVIRRRIPRHVYPPHECSSACAALKNLGACSIRRSVRR